MTQAQLAKQWMRDSFKSVYGICPLNANYTISGMYGRMAHFSDETAIIVTSRFVVVLPRCTLRYAEYMFDRAIRLVRN